MTEPRTANAWNWGGTDLTPRREAPAPSPAEQAVIDRFGIFEPEEAALAPLAGQHTTDEEAER